MSFFFYFFSKKKKKEKAISGLKDATFRSIPLTFYKAGLSKKESKQVLIIFECVQTEHSIGIEQETYAEGPGMA